MNKVLIIGSGGNLGTQFLKDFDSFPEFKLFHFNRSDLNLTEQESIVNKISRISPDIIINTAAYNKVDDCEEFEDEFELAKKINGEALRFLGEAAIKNDATLIHYSTDYVFGGDTCNEDHLCDDDCLLSFKERGGFREDDKPCPANKYGETKLMGEQELLNLRKDKLKYYIIRTSKLFGPKGKSNQSKDSFFDIMLKLSKNKKEIDVVNEELSCFTYVPDLVGQTFEILNKKEDFGIYHVRNSEPAIWYDAAKELFRLEGLNVTVNPVPSSSFPRPAKRPKYSVLANTKLSPLRDWREALKEYTKYLKN